MKQHFITFTFGDLEFSGLPLQKYNEYPWSNKKERREFYSELLENGSDAAREKTKLFLKKEEQEGFHINFSRYLVFSACAIFLIITTLILPTPNTLVGFLSPLVGMLTFSFLGIINYNKAMRRYRSYLLGDVVIDTIFEMESEIKTENEK